MYNINHGRNDKLVEKYSALWEYMIYVEKLQMFYALTFDEAQEQVQNQKFITDCRRNHISG